ncbi:MAG: trypsin-like peptidase domain-containing protein [Gammaproteobacteria bacterium]|nr:trypsin-like peptidase domain-containing protein [Gammaproteobacteria bacterium]
MTISNSRLVLISVLSGLLFGAAYHFLAREHEAAPAPNGRLSYGEQRNGNERPSMLPNSFHAAVVTAAPAVVSIYTEEVSQWQQVPGDRVFNNLFGEDGELPVNRISTSQGSGVIISNDGYIITNEHLVANADVITAALADGRQFAATKVGTDKVTDLAVLKINSAGALPQIRLAVEETPRVGDVVLTIGNPYGFGQTVTMGIVSATGRRNVTDTPLQDFIQVDAAINPGNSGGALVNPYGELIGINTAVYAPRGGAQGIGFAVPLRLVNYVVPQIIENQTVQRGWLGVQVDDLIYYPELFAKHARGTIVTGVFENSPAAEAGLQGGDIITHINGQPVINAQDLLLEATTTRPQTRLEISGWRGHLEFSAQATLAARP